MSVITARNTQKDMLNKLGAEKFARDTGQTLTDFYCTDRISLRAVDRSKWKDSVQSEKTRMSPSLREQLWGAFPSATNEFIPGKLSPCVDLPVMIGWDSSESP